MKNELTEYTSWISSIKSPIAYYTSQEHQLKKKEIK